MAHKTIEDFEDDGFSIYNEAEHPKKAPKSEATHEKQKEQPQSKIVIMDNKDVLQAVEHSNNVMKESMENLVNSLKNRPNNFTLVIERDQRGFMKNIKVKVDK